MEKRGEKEEESGVNKENKGENSVEIYHLFYCKLGAFISYEISVSNFVILLLLLLLEDACLLFTPLKVEMIWRNSEKINQQKCKTCFL